MKYILDTHTLLWTFSCFEELPIRIQNILKKSENDIYVSAVSLWEISIKKSLGKLQCPDNIIEMIYKNQFKSLDINFAHAQKIRDLPYIHNDPFNRLLISQSLIEGMPILTKDSIIKDYEVEIIWE